MLELSYGTIDIVVGLDDQDHFLEVNSMGDRTGLRKILNNRLLSQL